MSAPPSPPGASIDWQRPWLRPFLPAATGLSASVPDWPARLSAAAADQALTNARGLPLRFVPQERLPSGEAYEAFIDRTGGVPTRCNLHDYFNALAWLTYPASKRALNALQAAELTRRSAGIDAKTETAVEPVAGMRSTRGTMRDRATIFDENGAVLLCADPAFEQALRAHDWTSCFVTRRSDDACYAVRLFGHALLEKLVTPFTAITAHVWVLPVEPAFLAMAEAQQRPLVDALLGERLAQGLLAHAPTPLPVLGVPGWWPVQDAAFYADESVFRAKRMRKPDA